MLRGYTAPRTPLGRAAVTPPPPRHYSSDIVGVEYWADPAAVAALLPNALAPDPKSAGHALAMFLDWQLTAENDGPLDPTRYQYRATFVLVDAIWRDTSVVFCPFIYVDDNAAMARGWAQGFPKRLGSMFQTRSYAASAAAGGRFGSGLSVHGRRLAEARITPRDRAPDPRRIFSRPTVNLRYFARLTAGQHDRPAVNELVMPIADDLHIVDLRLGERELVLPKAPGEEPHSLTPTRLGAGFRCSMSYTVTDLRILKDFAS